MKNSTVIGIAILGALGLGAYWLYTKSQARTNTTTVAVPLGGGAGVSATIPTSVLAGGLSNLFSGLVNDIGGVFTGGGATQSQPTSIMASPTYSTPISTSSNLGDFPTSSDSSAIGDYSNFV